MTDQLVLMSFYEFFKLGDRLGKSFFAIGHFQKYKKMLFIDMTERYWKKT
jgi:hypothetical protein